MVALDFSKAFDVLNHKILLEEVNKAGIKGEAFKWIGDWLTGAESKEHYPNRETSHQDVDKDLRWAQDSSSYL